MKIITKQIEGWQNCFTNCWEYRYLHQHCQNIWIEPIKGKKMTPSPLFPTKAKAFSRIWMYCLSGFDVSFHHKNVPYITLLPWKHLLYITAHHQIAGNIGFCGSTWKKVGLSNLSPFAGRQMYKLILLLINEYFYCHSQTFKCLLVVNQLKFTYRAPRRCIMERPRASKSCVLS